jgi:hypothetical protein
MPRIRHRRSGAGDMADLDVFKGAQEPDNLKQVDHHRNHNNRVQDAFDFAIHGNVGVHEPEKHADNDQNSDDINERHDFFFCLSAFETLLNRQGSVRLDQCGSTHGQNKNQELINLAQSQIMVMA